MDSQENVQKVIMANEKDCQENGQDRSEDAQNNGMHGTKTTKEIWKVNLSRRTFS